MDASIAPDPIPRDPATPRGARERDAGDPSGVDPTAAALEQLGRCLQSSVIDLMAAAERVSELQARRARGVSWVDMVADEERPLIVERITRVLDELGEAGGRFRRAEAVALQDEGVSLNRIGQLFGVSRQRASALVKDRSHAEKR